MFKKLALVSALFASVTLPARAMEIKIENHTQHRITDFYINGYHHPMNAGPFETQWTGAYSESCGYHSFHAEAADGASWNGGGVCAETVFIRGGYLIK